MPYRTGLSSCAYIQKLAGLLQLPDDLVVVSAQILCLRVTIPADLYNSGILVEVQGVQARVNVNLENQGGEAKDKATPLKRNHSENPSKRIRADRPRGTQSHVHDPGGEAPSFSPQTSGNCYRGVSEYLPTTVDLATSFLHDEPKAERAQLEEAIAKSQSLEISDDDEAVDLGVANTLSLPRFLADFLRGVGDRVQVEIGNVQLDLDIKLDVVPEGSTNSDTSERSSILTIRMLIEHITINATALSATSGATEHYRVQGVSKPVLRQIRRMTMTKFQAMLISDASLFANITQSTRSSSPETAHTSTMAGPGSPPRESLNSTTLVRPIMETNDSRDSDASMTNDSSQRLKCSKPACAASNFASKLGLSNSDESQYHDSALNGSFYSTSRGRSRSHKEEKGNESLLGTSSLGEAAEYGAAGLLSTVSDNSIDTNSLEGGQAHPATSSELSPISRSTRKSHLGSGTDVQSRDSTKLLGILAKPQDLIWPINPSTEVPFSKSSSTVDRIISSGSEDLAQSKIFSHEEAESVYMSAISHISASHLDEGIAIPGEWSISNSDSDKVRGSRVSADGSRQQTGPTGIPNRLEASLIGDEVAGHHSDHGSNISQISDPDSTERIALPIDTEDKTVSIPRVPSQRGGSSQGSEASSANLKSPFTTMKRIISIDLITMEFPQSMLREPDSPTGIKQQPPAAWCQTFSGSLGSPSNTNGSATENIEVLHSNLESQQSGRRPIVDVGNIQISTDMSLARLMIVVMEKIDPLRSSSTAGKSRMVVPQVAQREASYVGLKVKRICWQFFDVVKGVPIQGVRSQAPLEQADLRGDSEILLKAEMMDFCAIYRNDATTSSLDLSIRKLSFGYLLDDILSFDPGLKMRESSRDILAPFDNDIKLIVAKTVSTTKIELTTLPLHIALDLRRLDETFAWFGGFSSMLGLGSSMMSTVTVTDVAAKSSNASKNLRGVRFEIQKQKGVVSSPSVQVQNKVTARIGGMVLDLQGARSSLRLESTAMKLVSRSEGLGLQVDRMNIIGPYLPHAFSEPFTTVKLSNLRVEYLSTPKEKDLDRLLALLSPSKDEYGEDDDILLDTLLRQRRQGGVVRATVENLEGILSDLDDLQLLAALSEDLRKLSNVTKYLPEDDRPGILTLMLIRHLVFKIQVNDSFGTASLISKDLEAAHVAFPSLVALGIATLNLYRNGTEELVGHAMPMHTADRAHSSMLMARFIGNEMEPTAKIKLFNVRFEYHVSTLVAIMAMKETAAIESLVADIASSVATLTTRARDTGSVSKSSAQGRASSDPSQGSKELRLNISLRDSTLGLNPRTSPSKGLVVFTDTHFLGAVPRGGEASAVVDVRKASLMVIDNHDNVSATAQSSIGQRSQIETLADQGYVSVSLISAAKATIHIVKLEDDSGRAIDIDIRDELFVLESCADSTQTLQSIIAKLTPPTPPCTELKYRTEVKPVEDMLASFSGDAFPTNQISQNADEKSPLGLDEGDMVDDEVPQNFEFVSSFYNPGLESMYEGIEDSVLENYVGLSPSSSIVRKIGGKNYLESFEEQTQIASDISPLEFQDDHFGMSSKVEAATDQRNTDLGGGSRMHGSPLRVRVRDAHFIWNLYDGYDWQHTRDTISQAIEDVQKKAIERLARNDRRKSADVDEEEESVIGDFLFNSIYIGVPANRDPRELGHQVNRNLDDLVSETESYATSTSSGSPSRKGQVPRSRGSAKLRLKRSKYHKMTFELKRVSADIIVFPPDFGDTQSSLDIKVQDLEIFDHVPTSTWKKFATYMHEAGERESGTDMIHFEILNVKPVPSLAASEIILKVR